MVRKNLGNITARLKEMERKTLVRYDEIDSAVLGQTLRAIFEKLNEIWGMLNHMGGYNRLKPPSAEALHHRPPCPNDVDAFYLGEVHTMRLVFGN